MLTGGEAEGPGEGPVECVIDLVASGDSTVVDVTGEIDQATRDLLAARLTEAIGSSSVVHVDLTNVSFMDSWGLSAVLSASAEAAERGVEFDVTAASRQVNHLFVVTGVAVDFGWPTFSEDV